MKSLLVLMVVLLSILTIAACGTSSKEKTDAKQSSSGKITYPQLSKTVGENEKEVEIDTSMGNIKIKLFPDEAPKAVENFIKHSEDGYYDGVIFHRVIKDFMIQGGDPSGNGTGGESIYGKPFKNEISKKLFNLRGALAMANSGPDTNGSQFFIVQNSSLDPQLKSQMEDKGFPKEIIKAYEERGGAPWLDGQYTVFGQVVEGMDVVDKIAGVETGANDKPVKDVTIKKIKVLKK
ncbi:peptidylprolyl isomerase [Falsibacillus albus]|uniref:Peptidyl-prolyl cis-trans isomerase n=1 Tax=Falsibacillus albus TaxID=2478915 RepID=A0A3L7K810_9BACI|nr:peptidylprolyl isomerase [Falsibacillus albus]RLQ96872.1 peptidylprolyl isomerase [Falsibacillus albus]